MVSNYFWLEDCGYPPTKNGKYEPFTAVGLPNPARGDYSIFFVDGATSLTHVPLSDSGGFSIDFTTRPTQEESDG